MLFTSSTERKIALHDFVIFLSTVITFLCIIIPVAMTETTDVRLTRAAFEAFFGSYMTCVRPTGLASLYGQ